jgi:hypothetical protein
LIFKRGNLEVSVIVRSAKGIETVDMQWGFKSAWSKQPLINAKAEVPGMKAKSKELVEKGAEVYVKA